MEKDAHTHRSSDIENERDRERASVRWIEMAKLCSRNFDNVVYRETHVFSLIFIRMLTVNDYRTFHSIAK